MRPEEKIEKRFVTECLALSIRTVKFEVAGDKGWPDRLIFMPNGKPMFIEFKQPGGKLSVHQEVKIEFLKSVGYDVSVYDNWEKAIEHVKSTLHPGQHRIDP